MYEGLGLLSGMDGLYLGRLWVSYLGNPDFERAADEAATIALYLDNALPNERTNIAVIEAELSARELEIIDPAASTRGGVAGILASQALQRVFSQHAPASPTEVSEVVRESDGGDAAQRREFWSKRGA